MLSLSWQRWRRLLLALRLLYITMRMCVCVCVCGWNELNVYAMLAYPRISSFRAMYTSTRTRCILKPFEDSEPTGLKVDIATLACTRTHTHTHTYIYIYMYICIFITDFFTLCKDIYSPVRLTCTEEFVFVVQTCTHRCCIDNRLGSQPQVQTVESWLRTSAAWWRKLLLRDNCGYSVGEGLLP